MQVCCINNSAHLVFTRSSGNPSNVPIIPAASPTVNIEATSSTSMLVDNVRTLAYCGVRTWWKIEAETERTSDCFFSQIERHRLTNEHRRWLWLCQAMICLWAVEVPIRFDDPMQSRTTTTIHNIMISTTTITKTFNTSNLCLFDGPMEWVVVVSGTDVFMWRIIACSISRCMQRCSVTGFPAKTIELRDTYTPRQRIILIPPASGEREVHWGGMCCIIPWTP